MFIWIVAVGGIFAFTSSMGIGSNDAANAFATSVGSKALTLKQAALLAVIFETSGAILMGSHVSDTIRKGISDYKCFEETPELLMYGCMWVLVSVTAWLFIASYYEMPVSTTHSCVGGMIGMTLAIAGSNCVVWYKETETFPYIGGVSGIVLSWFISPIFSGIIASILFTILRFSILKESFESYRINIVYPLLVGATLLINSFFIIYKGAKGIGLDDISVHSAVLYSFIISIIGTGLTIPVIPYVKNMIKIKYNTSVFESLEVNEIETNPVEYNINSKKQMTQITDIYNNAEKFDPKIEETFKYLQVFAAVCDSFSHGANDVANAIGPFAAIYLISKEHSISKKMDMGDDALWLLSIGGIGISLGLILYGKKIIYAIGNKLCKITPSRGTCIELSSALVIIAGSRLKIPLSTTHCQVGATIGVGMLENPSKMKNINWYILLKIIFGWIATCVIVGFCTYILSLQGIYSPLKSDIYFCNNQTLNYEL